MCTEPELSISVIIDNEDEIKNWVIEELTKEGEVDFSTLKITSSPFYKSNRVTIELRDWIIQIDYLMHTFQHLGQYHRLCGPSLQFFDESSGTLIREDYYINGQLLSFPSCHQVFYQPNRVVFQFFCPGITERIGKNEIVVRTLVTSCGCEYSFFENKTDQSFIGLDTATIQRSENNNNLVKQLYVPKKHLKEIFEQLNAIYKFNLLELLTSSNIMMRTLAENSLEGSYNV